MDDENEQSAADLLLSVGAPKQRRSSRCAAAASVQRVTAAAAEHAGSSPSPFQHASLASDGEAGGPSQRRETKPSLPVWDDEGSPPAIRTSKGSNIKGGRRSATRQRTSRFMGVGASNRVGQWQARILVHGKVTHLGYYVTEEEAARAYDRVSLATYGNAPTNFPGNQYSAADIAQLQQLDRASLQQALGVKPMQKSSRFRGVSRKKGRWEAKVMVSRKWAYRELFNSEEAAARAYDAAVWQLKPYEVAKAYVNFKDEGPPAPAAVLSKPLKQPALRHSASTNSPGNLVAVAASAMPPSPRGAAPAVPRGARSSLQRTKTAPSKALALSLSLPRTGSLSDQSLSSGAPSGGRSDGISDASRASSTTRLSAANIMFGGGSFSGGSAHSFAMGTDDRGGAGGSNPASPIRHQGDLGSDRQAQPPMLGLSLGWPSVPVLANLAPVSSSGTPHSGCTDDGGTPHHHEEQLSMPQVTSEHALQPGHLQNASSTAEGSFVMMPMDWTRPTQQHSPMEACAEKTSEQGDLSPPPYTSTAATMHQQDFFPQFTMRNCSSTPADEAAGMIAQAQAWSKDVTALQLPALLRAPLRRASAPHSMQLEAVAALPVQLPRGSLSSANLAGLAIPPASPSPRTPPLTQAVSPRHHPPGSGSPWAPTPGIQQQAASPGHASASGSPWAPTGTPSPHSPHQGCFSGGRPPPAPATAPPQLGAVMRSASTGALASQLGSYTCPTSLAAPPQMPRSASFAAGHGGQAGVSFILPSATSSEHCQDMLPELLQHHHHDFKQEPHESPLHMGNVHIGGETLTMFGPNGGGGSPGHDYMF